MRVSANRGHPWYNRELANAVHPYVDGKPVDNVITASEEDGLLVVLDVDAWRSLPPDAEEVPTYEMRGRVELVSDEEHERRQRAQAA